MPLNTNTLRCMSFHLTKCHARSILVSGIRIHRLSPILHPCTFAMAEPKPRDFASRARASTARVSSHNDALSPGLDVEAQRRRGRSSSVSNSSTNATGRARNTSTLTAPRESFESLRRRPTRQNTVRHYSSQPPEGQRGVEEPGAEPGVDTQQEDAVLRFQHLQAASQVTVVDFSEDRIQQHELDTASFAEFITRPKPDWVACRWMNVNGINFEVIRLLQKEKRLHRLAVEDLLQNRSRTKADWYSDHAFS